MRHAGRTGYLLCPKPIMATMMLGTGRTTPFLTTFFSGATINRINSWYNMSGEHSGHRDGCAVVVT